MAFEQHRVGWHAITLRKHKQVATDHLAPGDPASLAGTDDERAGAGKITQGFEGVLGAAFLNDGDHHRQDGKGQQNQRFRRIAEQQIDAAAAQQQGQHRLAQYLAGNP